MKNLTLLATALLLIIGNARRAEGQVASFGGAAFDAASDQVPNNWYLPMLAGVANTYEGYGENAGSIRTETFSTGEQVGGVKCIRWHVVVQPGSSPNEVIEDWWLAIDTSGDVRVLKREGTALIGWDASAPRIAPLFVPGHPAENQTWELFGRTFTITSVVESANAGVLALKSEAEAGDVRTEIFEGATGLISSETMGPVPLGASGWRRSTKTTPE